ncbi:hypothetical protein [Methylovorus mays]|uniref:hypothetical protein n=1 Tax=Methylovorus mays TaxID=184077 RepID=UPI001E4885CD|nr:hypothetical protein [Methylovorus mays]MCB5206098.1 hypothetical protein [Methylovorus mays]
MSSVILKKPKKRTPAQAAWSSHKSKATASILEAKFMQFLRAYKLECGWVTEHVFHPTREWRFDFARPDIKLAIEVEGGTLSGGRHTRGAGYEADCYKYNEAARLG